jgi:hypothetical protein
MQVILNKVKNPICLAAGAHPDGFLAALRMTGFRWIVPIRVHP